MPAALLLTGGASRRFGAPKADVRVQGERLADRSARLLAVVAAPVLEVGPGRSSLPAVCEDEPGSGPLVALAAGGAALADRGAGDESVIVLAVDLPFVDEAFLRWLADAASADAVVPRVGGRAQPLFARYSPGALARAAAAVADGTRSLHSLLEVLDVRWVDEAEWLAITTPSCFVDVDTPADARRVGLEPPG